MPVRNQNVLTARGRLLGETLDSQQARDGETLTVSISLMVISVQPWLVLMDANSRRCWS